jgi:hypothetical protein
VARAKRTDRAEARRRHHQAMAAERAASEAGQPGETAVIHEAARSGRPRQPSAPTPTPAAASPSIIGAFQAAIRPADIRADLAAFPSIALRSKAVWLPATLSIASAIAFVATASQANVITVLLFNAFVQPPPMATSFLGGILAPRAAWLVGGVTGLIAGVIYAVLVMTYPIPDTAGVADPGALRAEAALFALVSSPTLGVAVGAFAGFYRRFLRRAAPGQQRQGAKRPAKR